MTACQAVLVNIVDYSHAFLIYLPLPLLPASCLRWLKLKNKKQPLNETGLDIIAMEKRHLSQKKLEDQKALLFPSQNYLSNSPTWGETVNRLLLAKNSAHSL